jgi:hypothetical protein
MSGAKEMQGNDTERLERLVSMVEQNQIDAHASLREAITILAHMQANQKKELESIRFNTGWSLYILVAILISVSSGWFWQ